MRRILFIFFVACLTQAVTAQPAARRAQQQQQQQQRRNNSSANLTTRAKLDFPTAVPMSDDVVWRRDIYRELDLTVDENAGLYYPVEPIGSQMNLFTYIFKLMMTGNIKVYEYRLDGNEVFTDSARVKPLEFLDNYHIYYERDGARVRLDNSDIPSREVQGYYLKESAYYDQGTATFHKQVIALCPILMREDDFGDGSQKYPLFWVKYADLAPFLSKQTIMPSDVNNAATMSVDDYFTMNMYKGDIYKTTNKLGRTLAQYCPTDSAMTEEQKRIEAELEAFEKNIFGDQEKKDSLDSIANAKLDEKKVKKGSRNRRSGGNQESVSRTRRSRGNSGGPASGSNARVTVRRERH